MKKKKKNLSVKVHIFLFNDYIENVECQKPPELTNQSEPFGRQRGLEKIGVIQVEVINSKSMVGSNRSCVVPKSDQPYLNCHK